MRWGADMNVEAPPKKKKQKKSGKERGEKGKKKNRETVSPYMMSVSGSNRWCPRIIGTRTSR